MVGKLEPAKVTITMPKGCNRDALSIKALDRYTRELAFKTFITVDGKTLPCYSFKVMDDGSLLLEVAVDGFEIVQQQSAPENNALREQPKKHARTRSQRMKKKQERAANGS